MKTLKTIWKVVKILGKLVAFFVKEQSWQDLMTDIKATWQD